MSCQTLTQPETHCSPREGGPAAFPGIPLLSVDEDGVAAVLLGELSGCAEDHRDAFLLAGRRCAKHAEDRQDAGRSVAQADVQLGLAPEQNGWQGRSRRAVADEAQNACRRPRPTPATTQPVGSAATRCVVRPGGFRGSAFSAEYASL